MVEFFSALSASSAVKNNQKSQIMQNKPNLLYSQMNVKPVLRKDYKNETLSRCGKNKPKQTQFKANSQKAKMNVTSIITRDYEKLRSCSRWQNKPNQTQFQTQTNPIFTPAICTTCSYFTPNFNFCVNLLCGNIQVLRIFCLIFTTELGKLLEGFASIVIQIQNTKV